MPRSRLNLIGVAVLIVGVASADVLLLRDRNRAISSDQEILAEQQATKSYEASVERNVGKTGAMMGSWVQALENLGQPKPMAIIIGVVACLVAGGCFWVAQRRSEDA